MTFVIFPLVSRSTFAADREATRAYVTQTMRYALILAAAMGIVLAARPEALFGVIYKPEYRAGAPALPILAAGQCCLALLAVACAILNAAGRTRATVSLMVVTLAVGSVGLAVLVPARRARDADAGRRRDRDRARHGGRAGRGDRRPARPARRRVPRSPRWRASAPRSRPPSSPPGFVPGHGKIVGLAVMALAAIAYVAVLVVTREFGPEDRAKFARVFGGARRSEPAEPDSTFGEPSISPRGSSAEPAARDAYRGRARAISEIERVRLTVPSSSKVQLTRQRAGRLFELARGGWERRPPATQAAASCGARVRSRCFRAARRRAES